MNRPLIEYARHGLRFDAFPVFDTHAHVHAMNGCDALPLADQVAEMDRTGIDLATVSSTRAIGADFQRGNDDVAEALRRYPGRFLGYCHISAQYPDLILPELQRCFAVPGFRGIKVYQVGLPFDDPAYDPAWEFARAHKAPVLAHTWAGEFTGFDRAAEKHPEVSFLAGHAGSGFAYEPCIRAATRLPNFFLDLTYSREHTNMIEYFVEKVSADQIVWGTDVPTFSMTHQLGKVLFARIPDETKRKILCTNAERIFGIQVRKVPYTGDGG